MSQQRGKLRKFIKNRKNMPKPITKTELALRVSENDEAKTRFKTFNDEAREKLQKLLTLKKTMSSYTRAVQPKN